MGDILMRGVLFKTVIMLLLFVPALAAVPSLKIESAPHKINDDRTALLKVILEWPQAEGPYEVNPTEPALENLNLVKQNQSQETGVRVRQTITYEFQPLLKGRARVLPFEVSYRRSDADPWVPLLVPEQNFEVTSSVPRKFFFVTMWVLLGGALSFFAGTAIRNIILKRESSKKRVPPDPKQRIYAKAQEAITTFVSSDAKERLGHCAAQLRNVVSAYYDLSAEAATESEFLAILKKKGLAAGEWTEVSGLFDELEQMRFSRHELSTYELERMQKTLLQYIQGKIIMGNPN